MCDTTLSHVCHDSFIRETGTIHMWDATSSYVRHGYVGPFICGTIYGTRLLRMCDMEYCLLCTIGAFNLNIGCLQLGGSLRLQVSFAEYSLFFMARLQKRPMILRSLLIVATPYLMCDIDSLIRETRRIHMTCSYVQRDSFGILSSVSFQSLISIISCVT